MKHILLTIALSALACLTHAQQWSTDYHKADPMLNDNISYNSYSYIDEDGRGFTFFDAYPNIYKLFCGNIFDYDINGAVFVKVGLYNENDELLEQFTMYLYVLDNNHRIIETYVGGPLSTPIGQKGKVTKILNHIVRSTGYVRFLANLYHAPLFDLRVPTLSTYQSIQDQQSISSSTQSDSIPVQITDL